MKSRVHMRLSGLSGILAGVCLLLGLAFILAVFMGEAALAASAIFLTLGKGFELFFLFGIFCTQPQIQDKTYLAAFILSVFGLTVDLFPPLGRVLFMIGLLLFAVSTNNKKELPYWGFWLWLAGAVAVLVSSIFSIRLLMGIGTLFSAAALIIMGAALRRSYSEG